MQKLILPLTAILILQVILNAQQEVPVQISEDAMIVLQPADKITVSYIDVGPQGNPIEKSNIFTIRPDGTIFHELLGTVALANLTILEAEELLTQKFAQYFTQPKVAVSVIEKTAIKVILWGEVNKAGIFPVKPNTFLAEFIIDKGGATAEADLKRVTVSRADGTNIVFDMERYLFSNDPTNNVILKDRDKIIVPRYKIQERYGKLSKNYVLQYGNVLEISINELALVETNPTQSETYVINSEGNIFHRLFGLVHLGGITVDKAQSTLAEMAKRYYRDPIVSIDVIELSSRNVFVFGEVLRPGIYPIEGNIQLAEFLANIGGLSPSADLREIVVTRKQGKPIVFNMEDFLFKRIDSKNVYLEDGDRIIVQKRVRGFFVRLSERVQPFSIFISLISTSLAIFVILNRM